MTILMTQMIGLHLLMLQWPFLMYAFTHHTVGIT